MTKTDEFLALLEPLRHSLYGYARRVAFRADDAADLVQSVAMTAWREFDRFERGSNFRAWVFRILVHAVLNANKRTAREQVRRAKGQPDLDQVIDREDLWSEALQHPDRLREVLDQRLVHALEDLSSEERQSLMLRVLEDFSYKEISALLDVPVGTAMSLVFRARMKLRERLADLALETGMTREPLA